MLTCLALVPSTPLTLAGHPGDLHAEISELAGHIQRATRELGNSDVVAVLAGGPAGSGIRVTTHADALSQADYVRRGYGIPPVASRNGTHPAVQQPDPRPPAAAAVPAAVVTAADRIAAAGRGSGRRAAAPDRLSAGWADAQVLAVHGNAAAPDATLVLITVAPDVTAEAAADVAAPLLDLAQRQRTGLLVAGDLSAGHGPKPPRPGAATELDDQVRGALDHNQPERLWHLSVELGAQSQARAVGAIRVLGAVLTQVSVGMVVRYAGAPLGVGYVVAVGR